MNISYLFLVSVLSSPYHDKSYDDLSEEEKLYIDTFDRYLFFDEDEKVTSACSRMMFLLLKASVTIGTNEEITEEELHEAKSKIYSNLDEEEREKVDAFSYACIQCMGIYSEERVNERQLKKERK